MTRDQLPQREVRLFSDVRPGKLASLKVTLSGPPGTVTVITLPDTARGVRLYPAGHAVRFALNEDPAAEATSSSTEIAATAFAPGGIAKAEGWETRLLEDGNSRTLRLLSTAAYVVVEVEVF